MSAIKPKDLDHMENVYALVLAILYPVPLSAEQAFAKMGIVVERGKAIGSDVALLRDAGCSWGEIKELTGCRYPQSAYIHYQRRKGKRSKNVTSEKNEKADRGKNQGLHRQGTKGNNPHGCQGQESS